MKQITAILIGAGQRGNAYSVHAMTHPEELKIAGVAEPDDVRREEYKSKYDINDDRCFTAWQDVFTVEKWADAVMICTQDALHYKIALAAIEKGYDILLEKAIAQTAKECREIADAAQAKGVKVLVCHVLRYTSIFKAIKEAIENDEIGEVVSYVHNENTGDFHQAHSFVRGNWSNTGRSSPMILTKSCHDLDIIQWMIDKRCLRLSSFGSLSYFNKEHCPKDAPARCTDGCAEDCVYDARKVYVEHGDEWMRSVAAGHANPTNAEVEAAIKTGPYGRCVFQCDNDVVDHQTVSLEFEGGVTVLFSMSGLTADISRALTIMGTKGQIVAHTAPPKVVVSKYATPPKTINREILIEDEEGHSGGDAGIMRSFCAFVRGDINTHGLSEIGISADNHMLCFAAELSRLNNGTVVDMTEYEFY